MAHCPHSDSRPFVTGYVFTAELDSATSSHVWKLLYGINHGCYIVECLDSVASLIVLNFVLAGNEFADHLNMLKGCFRAMLVV